MENILEKINKSALKFLAPLTPDETYATIVSEALKLIGAAYGSILLENDGKLERVYVSLPYAHKTKVRQKGNTYAAYAEQKVIVADISETGNAHPELKKYGIVWTIFIPLSYEGKQMGVLTLNAKKKEKVKGKELRILKLYGSLASMAIKKMQLYTEMKTALETRDMFISLASHELRTPLTSINGYIQLLKSKMAKSDSTEAKWVRELHTESIRLTNLVSGLLELNRLKSGQLQFRFVEYEVSELIKKAIDMFLSENPDRSVIFQDLTKKYQDLIICDNDKMLSVISALLNNAAKFSPCQTEIRISLKHNKDDVIVQVADQGIGIPKEDLAHVFEEFYKVSGNREQGLGVGLFFAKYIIKRHKGTMGIRSEVKKGTTIEIKLPGVKK